VAGKIVADIIESAGSQISLNVGNVTILTASSTGLTLTPTTNVNINLTNSIVTLTNGSATAPGLTFSGNTRTGLFMPSANTLAFTAANTESMRITAAGDVGIGTTNPTNYAGYTSLSLNNATSGGVYDILTNNTRVASFFSSDVQTTLASITSIPLAFRTGNTERMRIDSSGNVLINSTSNINFAAASKLFVLGNGTGMAVGYGTSTSQYRTFYMNSGDGALYFHNNSNFPSLSSAGAWTNASDARLKKNIVNIKYGLADVLKMQPRSYQMNDVAGDFVGFVAQELKEIIPEVVSGDPEKQLGVDYGSLVAVAFKAIQELKVIVDAQAVEIAALKA
jgi:hypothetical protein